MSDDYFDLYVWYREDGTIHGFQLCYDKDGDQRALTWLQKGPIRHTRIDDGEESVEANRSPILTTGRPFAKEPLRSEFVTRGAEIELELRTLVLAAIDAFGPAA